MKVFPLHWKRLYVAQMTTQDGIPISPSVLNIALSKSVFYGQSEALATLLRKVGYFFPSSKSLKKDSLLIQKVTYIKLLVAVYFKF